jgi:CBS domain-containing protein
MLVKDLMSRDVRVIPPDETLKDAAREMEAIDAGFLPVCEGNKLVGIVTDRDITIRATAGGIDPRKTRVRDIMTREVIACSEDQDVADAVKVMEDAQIRRVPVLDREMRLTGIVSVADVAVRTHNRRLAGELIEHVSGPVAKQHRAPIGGSSWSLLTHYPNWP